MHAGVSERFEIGARAWSFTVPTLGTEIGGAIDTKISLRRPAEGKGTHVSAVLSISYHQPRMLRHRATSTSIGFSGRVKQTFDISPVLVVRGEGRR